jgi:hypothetical protein
MNDERAIYELNAIRCATYRSYAVPLCVIFENILFLQRRGMIDAQN